MKTENLKKNYVPPTVSVVFIEMEDGIVSGSSTIKPIETSQIEVEDWEEVQGNDIGSSIEI